MIIKHPNLLIACAHESGHYVVYRESDIECSYPRIFNPTSAYPSGYVEVPPGPLPIIPDLIGTLAGEMAERRIIDKYNLRTSVWGCASDRRHVDKYKKLSEKSIGWLKTQAKKKVILFALEIDRLTMKLMERYEH